MTVRAMSVEDLRAVLDWAADEGWNPGLDDAPAFHAADPHGFFLKEVDGLPVAAVSVVNHNPRFAFLGLYLCRPEFRGLGHGMDVWRAALLHAGDRYVGLDGVPDQQANYARSGFAKIGRTVRYEGDMVLASDPRVRPIMPSDLPALITADARATGFDRPDFAGAWFSRTATRETVVMTDGTELTGFATFRKCQSGIKVGPLHASSMSDAVALLGSRPAFAAQGPLFVDVPDSSEPLSSALLDRGFAPVFETARMFTGQPPVSKPPLFHAIATMELG